MVSISRRRRSGTPKKVMGQRRKPPVAASKRAERESDLPQLSEGPEMNVFGQNLLVVCLSGMLALPVGYCCGATANSRDGQATSARCCEAERQSRPKRPEVTESCCCQDRVNATVAAKPVKRALTPSLPATLPSNKPQLRKAWGLLPHAFFVPGERSFQSLFCVWRR